MANNNSPASRRFPGSFSDLLLMKTPCLTHLDRPLHRSERRSGFSFVEVLFAVMILGIGFIMVAGIFPVAMSQTAATQEDTIGAALSRGAVATFAGVAYSERLIPSNGIVLRLTDDSVSIDPPNNTTYVKPWSLIKGNQILGEDQRFD